MARTPSKKNPPPLPPPSQIGAGDLVILLVRSYLLVRHGHPTPSQQSETIYRQARGILNTVRVDVTDLERDAPDLFAELRATAGDGGSLIGILNRLEVPSTDKKGHDDA